MNIPTKLSIMNKNTNLNDSFQTLMNSIFIKYKGCLIERCGNKFRVMDHEYPTLYLAKKSIDLIFKKFGHNLIK